MHVIGENYAIEEVKYYKEFIIIELWIRTPPQKLLKNQLQQFVNFPIFSYKIMVEI